MRDGSWSNDVGKRGIMVMRDDGLRKKPLKLNIYRLVVNYLP